MEKKLRNFLSYSLVSALVMSASVGVGAYYIASSKSLENNVEYNGETENVKNNGILDDVLSKIVKPEHFYEVGANQYFLQHNINTSFKDFNEYIKQSKTDFEAKLKSVNNDFNINNFYVDVFSFVKNIYNASNSKLSIALGSSDFKYDETNHQINFSLKFNFKNVSNDTTFFRIQDNTFYFKAHESRTIVINSTDGNFNYILNHFENKNYLGWNTNIEIIDNQNSITINNFCFTQNSYSIALPFIVDGIKNNNSYLNLVSQNDYYSSLTQDFLLNDTEKYINSNMDMALSLIGDVKDIVKVIGKNPTLNEFLQQSSTSILNILTKFINIEDQYKDVFAKFIVSQDSIIKILSENKTVISNFIASLINDPVINGDLIKSFLDPIDFNKSDEEIQKDVTQLKDLISYFISTSNINIDINFVYGLMDKVFDKNTTTISLINYYLNTKKDELLTTFNIDANSTIGLIINLLGLVVKEDGNTHILTAIGSEEGRDTLNKLLSLMLITSNPVQPESGKSALIDIVSQIVNKDNTSLNDVNLQAIINNVLVVLLEYFADGQNYRIEKGFNNFKYVNNKVTYSYHINIIFIKEVKFDIESLINVLPDNLSLGKISLPKSILQTMLKQDGKFLEIKIGNNDTLSFNFSATNEDVYLTPKKENSYYIASYSIPYNLTMKLKMPYMFNSITKFYPTGTLNVVNNEIFEVLKTFLQQFVLRDYNFVGHISIDDGNTIIQDYDPNLYIENNTFKWKRIDSNFLADIKNNLERRENKENTYQLEKRVKPLFGSEKIEKFSLTGLQPSFKTESYKQTIESNTLEYQSDIKPQIWIDPTMLANITINVFGIINLGTIEINELKIYVWFPYKVLNLTDPDNPKLENEFSVSLTL